MSLGLRLMLLNGLVLILVLGAFASITYVTQQQTLQSNLDASLRDQARLFRDNPLLWFDPAGGRPRNVAVPGPQAFVAPDVFIQVTTRDGETVARSRNLNDQVLPSSPEQLQQTLDGKESFTDVVVDGQQLRMYLAPLRIGPRGEGP